MRRFLTALALGSLALGSPAAAAPSGYDLQAVRLEHGELRMGEPAEVRVTVRNAGPGQVSGVQVTLSSEGRVWGTLRARQELKPGQELVLAGTFSPAAPGAGTLRATVLPEDADPGNGTLEQAIQVEPPRLPDLQIRDLSLPKGARAGEPANLGLRVVNEGEAPTGGARVGLLVDGRPAGTWRLQQRLKPGQGEAVTLAWTPAKAGPRALTVVLDPDGAVAEAEEGNNREEAAVEVAEARKPDLLAQEILPSGELRQGRPAEVLVRVGNKGTAAAHSVVLQLKVGGEVAAERTVRLDIAPGGERAIPLTWIPKAAGPVALEVVVDPQGRYAEGSRENNTARRDLAVLPAAAPDLQAVRLDAPDRLVVGREVRLEAVVRNEGDLPAFSCRVTLLVDGEPAAVGSSHAGLDPGGEVRVPLRWTPERVGSARLEFVVETRSAGAERNPEDNRAGATFEVGEPKERKAP